jgi:hypothetical protein
VLNIRLNLYDIVFWSSQKNLIDVAEVTAWKQTIARNLQATLAQDHWNESKVQYEPQFRKFIDSVIREIAR